MAQEEELLTFDEYFNKAKEAYVEKQYEEAIPLLQKAFLVSGDARVFINIALAYEKLGECHKSIVYYRALLEEPDVDKSRKSKGKKALKRLLKQCKTFDENLSGRLTLISTPPGATVYIDGTRSGTTPMEAVALVRGKHEVRMIKGDMPPVTKRVDLAPEKDEVLEIDLTKKPVVKKDPVVKDKVEPKPKENLSTPPKVEPKDDGVNIPAIALLGAGVASLGVAIYIDFVDIPSIDDERETIGQEISRFGTETPEYQSREAKFNELTDTRNSRSTIAVASYVAGGLLVGAGAGWLIWDMVSEPGDSEGVTAGVSVTPSYQGGYIQFTLP